MSPADQSPGDWTAQPVDPSGRLARRDPVAPAPVAPAQVVAAAGTAIVAASRVGRLISRSGWRIARTLPGAQTLEREAQRIQKAAAGEIRRIIDTPAEPHLTVSPEERRAVLLIGDGTDPEPLRSAMGELLARSIETNRDTSREYLFGTIISQLVPDEARVVAALSDGRSAASADVIVKAVGRRAITVLQYASTIGRAAGVSSPESTPVYLSRLLAFGLLRFGPEQPGLGTDYEILAADDTVRAAMADAEKHRRGSVRLDRGTVALSPLGLEFWAASDPSRAPEPPAGAAIEPGPTTLDAMVIDTADAEPSVRNGPPDPPADVTDPEPPHQPVAGA